MTDCTCPDLIKTREDCEAVANCPHHGDVPSKSKPGENWRLDNARDAATKTIHNLISEAEGIRLALTGVLSQLDAHGEADFILDSFGNATNLATNLTEALVKIRSGEAGLGDCRKTRLDAEH